MIIRDSYLRRHTPLTGDLPARGEYIDAAYVVYHGYRLRDKLKAAGFTYCSPDQTWRRAMTAAEYAAFDVATIGMRNTSRDWR